MKSTSLLRVLSLLGFLLLIAPFYDQCNGKGMKYKQAEEAEVSAIDVKDSIPVQKIEVKEEVTLNSEKGSFFTRAYEFIDDEETQNAYELSEFLKVYYDMTFADFKADVKEDFKNNKYDPISYLIRSIAFLLIIVFALLQLITSILKHYKRMYKLSILNIVMLIVALISIVFFDSMFETYRQIKWGFYAFFVVQIALFYFSKRQLRSITN